MHKGRYFLLIFLLVLTTLPAMGYSFPDVSEQDPYRAAIDYLSDEGILEGQGDSERFDPNGFLNRAEWAVILGRALGEEPDPDEYGFCFPDVSDEWYAASVCFAEQKEWVRGYLAGVQAGLFVPTNGLNVAEILVTLQRQRSWPVVEGNAWYVGALTYAQIANLVDPSWTFDHRLTRAEAAEVLFRTIAVEELKVARYDPLLAELLAPSSGTGGNIPRPNQQEFPHVSLVPFGDMPSAFTNLSKGAQYVPVLRFTLESDQEVTLNQLSVRRVSQGYSGDLRRGRLAVNGQVIKESAFSTDTNAARWNDLHQVLEPGQPVLFEVNVDFAATAGSSLIYQFQIEPNQILFTDKTAVIDGATVIGKKFTTSGLAADMVTVNNPPSKLNLPFVQTERATIAKFTIKTGQHDVLLRRIRLISDSGLNSQEFRNFRLTAGNEEISFIENLDRSVLDFSINDYPIDAERERTLSVLADIDEPSINTAIRLVLDDSSDVYAYDTEFGYGTQINNQFNRTNAWCLGSNTPVCPKPGLRKHCSKDDVENRETDCF